MLILNGDSNHQSQTIFAVVFCPATAEHERPSVTGMLACDFPGSITYSQTTRLWRFGNVHEEQAYYAGDHGDCRLPQKECHKLQPIFVYDVEELADLTVVERVIARFEQQFCGAVPMPA